MYAPRSLDPLLLMIPYSALNEDRKQGNKGERRLGRANGLKIASPPSSLSDIPRGGIEDIPIREDRTYNIRPRHFT